MKVLVKEVVTGFVQTTRLPTLEELLAERGAERTADAIAPGFEGLE